MWEGHRVHGADGELVSKSRKPLIWVAVISHRHGTNAYASKTKDGLYRQIRGYVREWWDTEITCYEFPEEANDYEVVRQYFDSVERECLEVCPGVRIGP